MAQFKKPFLFALCLLPIALVGGWLVGLYQMDLYGEAMLEEVIAQLGSREMLPALAAYPSAEAASAGDPWHIRTGRCAVQSGLLDVWQRD